MKKKKKEKSSSFLKTNNWAQCAWVICADCYVLKLWSANTHWTILTVESSRRISVEYIKFKLCYFLSKDVVAFDLDDLLFCLEAYVKNCSQRYFF